MRYVFGTGIVRWQLRRLHRPIFARITGRCSSAYGYLTHWTVIQAWPCQYRGVSDDSWADAVSGLAVAAVAARLAGRICSAGQLLAEVTTDGKIVEALSRTGASFVTLRRESRLRGCIGNLATNRALHLSIVHNARQAMVDPRLEPVVIEEWPWLSIEVSVLSDSEPMDVTGRDDLLAALRPGVDGLTLLLGDRRTTFLPTVWESLGTPERFVSGLLAKGGWGPAWPADMRAERYTTRSYSSRPPRPQLEGI
ncbi:uncharacterized protein (TIGR00296 family)/AmmeMemoRadiSam system protein A [Stackebrandtia endophytica]|uniref:Uncharacterized protein (TIGR00296 family)/AmmeMemoRadiSam system protein A n=1 Tax=Stackebrandtia endophytica TaxID=1496996 RepID=A0A543AU56_9ACTN|nr:uncharacterized protein (TIGR00296 family)/AmmeMemoRadiSam system protein A [Stackebrandtia endophytica]